MEEDGFEPNKSERGEKESVKELDKVKMEKLSFAFLRVKKKGTNKNEAGEQKKKLADHEESIARGRSGGALTGGNFFVMIRLL